MASSQIVIGDAARSLLHEQIAAHSAGILKPLEPFDAASATQAWIETIRGVEELINLLMEASDQTCALFKSTPIVSMRIDPRPVHNLARLLAEEFDDNVAARFVDLCTQVRILAQTFLLDGNMHAAGGLQTVADAIGYFQSRRRHLVTLLYMMPAACKGTERLDTSTALTTFLPAIEHCALSLTGLYQNLMLADVYDDFELKVGALGFRSNKSLDVLSNLFLEPERLPIVDADPSTYAHVTRKPMDRKVLSAVEVEAAIELIEAAYAEFDVMTTPFALAASACRSLLVHVRDDYFIRLSRADLDALVPPSLAKKMVQKSGSFIDCTNGYAPFVEVGGEVHSTVMLLQRFLYYYKNVCLNKVKRFQIRSGFEFEGSVRRVLAGRGFKISKTKRIERQEFDVLATHRGVVYNIQCKNNLVDLTRIETDRKKFVRYNRGLERAYLAALAKEEAREHLLRTRFDGADVRHFVISRFPVATLNPRILTYVEFEKGVRSIS